MGQPNPWTTLPVSTPVGIKRHGRIEQAQPIGLVVCTAVGVCSARRDASDVRFAVVISRAKSRGAAPILHPPRALADDVINQDGDCSVTNSRPDVRASADSNDISSSRR